MPFIQETIIYNSYFFQRPYQHQWIVKASDWIILSVACLALLPLLFVVDVCGALIWNEYIIRKKYSKYSRLSYEKPLTDRVNTAPLKKEHNSKRHEN